MRQKIDRIEGMLNRLLDQPPNDSHHVSVSPSSLASQVRTSREPFNTLSFVA